MNESAVLKELFELVEKYMSAQRSGKFLEYQSPGQLKTLLNLEAEGKSDDWDEIFTWVKKYFRYSVKTNHPMFVNRMWVGANLPSIVGEIAAAVTNTSACTFESAPVSTMLEKYMIDEMLAQAGFTNGEGQMTTGSSNANMIAMMAARNGAGTTVKQSGLFGQRKLFAFVGAEAHYSMDKAANTLGIGTDQLVKVPLDEMGSMIPGELRLCIERVLAGGGEPFFVSATAGTTVRGAYDPIEPLLRLREQFGFWLHVDGAWGGGVFLSESLRPKFLEGLEHVDSFTCDFHKMLGSALMCNILLINNSSHTLGNTISAGDGSYLFRDEHSNEVEDLGTVSLQCGRKVDSLKWFLDWKFYGRKGLAERLENYYRLCEYAEQWVNSSDELEMYVPRASFNVCFRYKTRSEVANEFNLALRTKLHETGTSLVGVAYIHGVLVLRLLITNPAATEEDIDDFFTTLVAMAKELEKR